MRSCADASLDHPVGAAEQRKRHGLWCPTRGVGRTPSYQGTTRRRDVPSPTNWVYERPHDRRAHGLFVRVSVSISAAHNNRGRDTTLEKYWDGVRFPCQRVLRPLV